MGIFNHIRAVFLGDSELGGEFDALASMHPARMRFIVNNLENIFGAINGIRVLDVGCGIGLTTESLERLGAKTTGIDASRENISRAIERNIDINYICTKMETWDFCGEFDAIVALEVIEHCDDPQHFLYHCSKYLRNGGVLIISTIDRTILSLVTAKFGAEYVLKVVPKGTHDWNKFIRPGDLREMLSNVSLDTRDICGIKIYFDGWRLSTKPAINYMIAACKTH